MIVWILAAAVVVMAAAYFFLARNVSRLDEKREVVHLYENVEWNTEAVTFVKKKIDGLKWSIISWIGGLMLLQTLVLFLAIIYVLENAGR